MEFTEESRSLEIAARHLAHVLRAHAALTGARAEARTEEELDDAERAWRDARRDIWPTHVALTRAEFELGIAGKGIRTSIARDHVRRARRNVRNAMSAHATLLRAEAGARTQDELAAAADAYDASLIEMWIAWVAIRRARFALTTRLGVDEARRA